MSSIVFKNFIFSRFLACPLFLPKSNAERKIPNEGHLSSLKPKHSSMPIGANFLPVPISYPLKNSPPKQQGRITYAPVLFLCVEYGGD